MKKFKNRVCIVFTTLLFTLLTGTGTFAAGQYFSVFKNPGIVASAAVIGIILVIMGIVIGANKDNNNDDNNTD